MNFFFLLQNLILKMDNNSLISAAEQATRVEKSQALFPKSVFVFGVFRPGDDTFRIGSERVRLYHSLATHLRFSPPHSLTRFHFTPIIYGRAACIHSSLVFFARSAR